MPSTLDEELQTMNKFREIVAFKGVIGAIDCTHIKIPSVGGDMGQFYINRKNYSSINVQVVCDASMKINNMIAHWRESTHDSRIFNECQLKVQFENGVFHGRLLGDSGYACTPYLFTPLLNPITQEERAYNRSHISTRNVVERCFGVWKSRFQCLLRGFKTSLENTKMYIVTLAVLHNIAIQLDEQNFDENDMDQEQHLELIGNMGMNQRGAVARAIFIEENF